MELWWESESGAKSVHKAAASVAVLPAQRGPADNTIVAIITGWSTQPDCCMDIAAHRQWIWGNSWSSSEKRSRLGIVGSSTWQTPIQTLRWTHKKRMDASWMVTQRMESLPLRQAKLQSAGHPRILTQFPTMLMSWLKGDLDQWTSPVRFPQMTRRNDFRGPPPHIGLAKR